MSAPKRTWTRNTAGLEASARRRTEATRRKSGIPIPAKLWEELEGIAKTNAVKMPALK